MSLLNCYQNDGIFIRNLFKKLQVTIPVYVFGAIQEAYENKNHKFKCIVLVHLAKLYKKNKVSTEDYEELISLLDAFSDPYQSFIEDKTGGTWDEIKQKILRGI